MYKDDGFFDAQYEEIFCPGHEEDPIKFCLRRIYELEQSVKHLYDLVPIKYKKFNPKSGENSFFSLKEINPSKEDYESDKKRMSELLRKIKRQLKALSSRT